MTEQIPPEIARLLQRNKEWASKVTARNPSFFEQSASLPQKPTYLFISCADSRVPINEIVGGIPPGEIFVHRNIANIVHPTDISLMSVLTYAIDYLKIKHIIVLGHYGCGGVKSGILNASFDLLDLWLRPIKDIQQQHSQELKLIPDEEEKYKIMCELNTLNSANSIAYSNVVQKAWSNGNPVSIRAWIYDIASGLIRDLDFVLKSANDISDGYRFVIDQQKPQANTDVRGLQKESKRTSQIRVVRNPSQSPEPEFVLNNNRGVDEGLQRKDSYRDPKALNDDSSTNNFDPRGSADTLPLDTLDRGGQLTRNNSIGREKVNGRGRSDSVGRDGKSRGQSSGRERSAGRNDSNSARRNDALPPALPRTFTNNGNPGAKSILKIRLRHPATDQSISLAVPATSNLANDDESIIKILNKLNNALDMHGIEPSRSRITFFDKETGDLMPVADVSDFKFVLEIAKVFGMGLGMAPLEFDVLDGY